AERTRAAYGSRINGTEGPREKYQRVKEVEGPVTVVLKNGVRIRLAGVAVKEETRRAAMDYLAEATAGQPVYYRKDSIQKPGEDGAVPAYLFLKNRTFLNSQLIRRGLALADRKGEYDKKARFMKLRVDRAAESGTREPSS
ncbi:MAG: hypothetical protein JRI97_12175, partial [Deltaproteobacteria bacterium]|nr:hypothetical protein [Deltaproteobacteria bacterium]